MLSFCGHSEHNTQRLSFTNVISSRHHPRQEGKNEFSKFELQ